MLPAKSKIHTVEHHAALDWREAPTFMTELAAREGGIGARALAFAIFTAVRSGEVRKASWNEIDFDGETWTIPASRMKTRSPHRVPLSEPALEILCELAKVQQGSLIFPGRDGETPLPDMTLTAVLRRMGRGELTAHGSRSTFRDWAADHGKIADVAEGGTRATIGNRVTGADERTDLYEQRRADFVGNCPASVRRPAIGRQLSRNTIRRTGRLDAASAPESSSTLAGCHVASA